MKQQYSPEVYHQKMMMQTIEVIAMFIRLRWWDVQARQLIDFQKRIGEQTKRLNDVWERKQILNYNQITDYRAKPKE